MQRTVKNLSLFWVRSNQEQLASQDIHVTAKFEPSAAFALIPTWSHGFLREIQFIKVAIFQVQNGQILTYRILTRGVEAGQACLAHRSSTHATTLTRMGSIGFTWVACEADERSKFVSQSRTPISSAISCHSPVDRASHTPWRTLPAHIITSPSSYSSLLESYSCESRSLSRPNSFILSHLSPQAIAQPGRQ
jgi:hypothetical protein